MKNPKDLKLYLKTLDFKPINVDILEHLANIFYREKEYKKASKYYGKIIEIIPNHEKAFKTIRKNK